MSTLSTGSKSCKNCYTCRYWSAGNTVRVTSPKFVKYDRKAEGICNLTGHKRSSWMHCLDHEKRLDF